MAKTFDKLLEQKPAFISQGEPISGSSDPSTQDAVVQADGTITSTLEGVNNRVPAHLWGQIKLMIDILREDHNTDGSHNIDDGSISSDADIAESKLALDFEEDAKPDGTGNYTSTSELAAFIATLWPIRNTSAASSYYSTNNTTNVISSIENNVPVFWQDFSSVYIGDGSSYYGGTQDAAIVAKDEYIYFGGYKIHLSQVNTTEDTAIVDLGPPDGVNSTPTNITSTRLVALEIWNHNITESGIGFYGGNVQYQNTNVTDDAESLGYHHTDNFIRTDDASFDDFIFNIENHIFLNKQYEFMQKAWVLNTRAFDYSNYKNGCDDPTYRTYYGNKTIVPSMTYYGCWESTDGEVVVIPVAMISRRNAGVYHRFLNPGGQAVVRTGATVNSYSDCFYRDYIGYFDASGVECPDYIAGVYNSNTDTYSYGGTTYYRSGTANTLTRASYITDATVEEIIPEYDIISLKRSNVYPDEALHATEQIILSGQTEAFEFRSIENGESSSTTKSSFFSKKAPQYVGFGDTEVNVFGSGNVGGVFVNTCNNGITGTIDGVRKIWTDRDMVGSVAFSFTQGNASSEDKPTMLAYDPTSRTVSVNTDGLSGSPIVYSGYTPVLTWENGEAAILNGGWSGLGSGTAVTTIDETDHDDHAGQKMYGTIQLYYGKGAGTPYVLNNVSEIKDLTDTSYSWFEFKDKDRYLGFTYDGTVAGTPTTTTVELDGFAYDRADYYVGEYLTLLETGETSRIVDYDGTTQVVTVETAFASAPSVGDSIVIHPMDDDTTAAVYVDPKGRGILGNVKRKRIQATNFTVNGNPVGVVPLGSVIYAVSTGSEDSTPTIKGSVITGLAQNEYVDVLYEDNTIFETGFTVRFEQSKPNNMFRSVDPTDTYDILAVGNLFSTNIGSVNNPESAYRGFIPTVTVPSNSQVKWVGSSSGRGLSSLTNLRNVSWAQVSPFEGAYISGADLTVSFKYFTDTAYLVSLNQVIDVNSGCHVGFLLVRSRRTKRNLILTAVVYKNNFGFDSSSYVYVVDANKIFNV